MENLIKEMVINEVLSAIEATFWDYSILEEIAEDFNTTPEKISGRADTIKDEIINNIKLINK